MSRESGTDFRRGAQQTTTPAGVMTETRAASVNIHVVIDIGPPLSKDEDESGRTTRAEDLMALLRDVLSCFSSEIHQRLRLVIKAQSCILEATQLKLD